MAHQAPHDVEAEPGTLPDRLGREERFEHAVADRGRDARSVVDDANHDALPLDVRGHIDAAAVGNGVERVVDQIGPDLIELADEAADLRQSRFQLDGHGG